MSEDYARPVVHWEIQSREPEKLRDFYTGMFNWQIGDGPVMFIPVGIGQEQVNGHIAKAETSGITLFIQVRDLRESLDRAPELGGKVLGQPFDVPGGPTVAPIADPEGNRLVLVQQ